MTDTELIEQAHALYHLKKIIGLSQEIQEHKNKLKELGIVLPEQPTHIKVIRGIDRFGLPIKTFHDFRAVELAWGGYILFDEIKDGKIPE